MPRLIGIVANFFKTIWLIWRLTKYCFVLVFAGVVPWLAFEFAPWQVVTIAILAWLIFAKSWWIRSNLDGLVWNSRVQKHDTHETAKILQRMKTSYVLTDDMFCKSSVFLGYAYREGRKRKYFVELSQLHKNHVSILGASGTGKTKIASWILCQQSAAGDAVVIEDPKSDEFLPGLMAAQATGSGIPFVFINLAEPVPQLNIFAGTTQEQREQLLQAALNLDPSGNPAVDFYRGEDRDACVALVATGHACMLSLLAAGAEKPEVTERKNFWREFRDLARLPAFHTNDGPDMAATIKAGGIVYVAGSTTDLRVMAAQKMVLTRVLQIISSRPRHDARQVALFLDEYKYLLSNSAMRALGTIRDRRCNLILAYQSFGDLADCGALNPVAVLAAAKGNTTIKFVYKMEDAATAQEFSDMNGKERIFSEVTNKVAHEGIQGGGWHESDRNAVSIDMLTVNLPKPNAGEASVCWVFGLGPAFPLATMHLPAGKQPNITPATLMAMPTTSALDANEAISLKPKGVSKTQKAKAETTPQMDWP